jgi:OOP family OmpA-OmpF porin
MRLPAAIFATIAGLGAPAAAAQDGEPFRVFFDWSKPELTRDAEPTLQDVVAAFRQSQPARVEVAGHSDRSGPAGINLAASRRRAEAVKTHLIANGIPAARITVSTFGESRPFVPTEDGVREAQNRRVEIRFEPVP